MDTNERVRELRKALGLTLEKFGAKLGVGKNAISRIETGKSTLTDQMFLAICREYNVNPEWLRIGEGSMLLEAPDQDDYLAAAASLSDDPLVVSCLIEYAKLRPDERAVVKSYVDNLIKQYKKDVTD